MMKLSRVQKRLRKADAVVCKDVEVAHPPRHDDGAPELWRCFRVAGRPRRQKIKSAPERPERTSDFADQGKIKQSSQRFTKNNGAVRNVDGKSSWAQLCVGFLPRTTVHEVGL